MTTEEQDLQAWLAVGMDRGWCSTPYCEAHDMAPLTDEERARQDEDEPDHCRYAVRLFALADLVPGPDPEPEVPRCPHGCAGWLDWQCDAWTCLVCGDEWPIDVDGSD